MKEMKELATLLVTENVEELKKGIVEIILENINSEIKEMGYYIITDDDIEELLEDVREEMKSEIQKRYRDKIMAEIDLKFPKLK